MNRSWYIENVDKGSPDSVHQILAFGTIEDIKSLKKSLSEVKIRELFLRYPKKVYNSPSLNFIKSFILHIDKPIDEQKYLEYTPRNIR